MYRVSNHYADTRTTASYRSKLQSKKNDIQMTLSSFELQFTKDHWGL